MQCSPVSMQCTHSVSSIFGNILLQIEGNRSEMGTTFPITSRNQVLLDKYHLSVTQVAQRKALVFL